jgi:hypothetical protein
MVKISLEKGLGFYNREYVTMVVRPETGDRHFRNQGYMPKHTEICEIIEKLVRCEPPSKRATLANAILTATIVGSKATVLNPDKPPSVRIYLNVPFALKDKAKGLGAKWDFNRKKWYSLPQNPNRATLVQLF